MPRAGRTAVRALHGRVAWLVAAAAAWGLGEAHAGAQEAGSTRAGLARTASFTVTSVAQPKGKSKVSQVTRVEVKGNKARTETVVAGVSTVTLIEDKAIYVFNPGSKLVTKQQAEGDMDAFLRRLYEGKDRFLKTAKKVGTESISGQPTDVYRDEAAGVLIYLGTKPGFRLPVKITKDGDSGSETLLVTDVKTNITLPDARFALPQGAQVIEARVGPEGDKGQ